MPDNAVRCPSCGHHQGGELTIEVGRDHASPAAVESTHRRRRDVVVLAAGAIGVLALLAVVGRDSSSDVTAKPTTTSTATTTPRRARTTSTTSTSSTTSTTTPPTTSTLPSLQLGTPMGVRLIVGGQRGVALVDLDTGDRQLLPLSSGSAIVRRRNGVVVNRGRDAYFVEEPFVDRGVDLGGADNVVASPAEDRVWLITYGDQISVREVSIGGATTAGPFTLPSGANPIGAVSTGFVVVAHGSIYVIDRSGASQQVGTGDAFAAAANDILAVSCDRDLQCGTSVIDSTSGATHPVSGFDPSSVGAFLVVTAPDGHALAFFDAAPGGRVWLRWLDLQTFAVSTVSQMAGSNGPGLIAFSGDSQWLFFVDSRGVAAFRPGLDAPLSVELGENVVNYLVGL